MIPNKRYTVTKASDNGTFEIGDSICLHDDGTLTCHQAMGWIDAQDVPAATDGMECELDTEWVETQRAKFKAALAALDEGRPMSRVPEGFVLVQAYPDKAVDLSGGPLHGWLFFRHADGQFVSERKLSDWELMQVEDQRDDGIVIDDEGGGQ